MIRSLYAGSLRNKNIAKMPEDELVSQMRVSSALLGRAKICVVRTFYFDLFNCKYFYVTDCL